MSQCPICKSRMITLDGKTEEGIVYKYTRCTVCDNEIIERKTFHAVTQDVRASKRYTATVGRWGRSLGVRIPKEVAAQFGLEEKKEVVFIAQKDSARIIFNS